MKLKLKRTPEQIELFKATVSSNLVESHAARQALAALVGPIAQEVLNQEGTSRQFYETLEFDENSNPSIQLDLYVDAPEGTVSVWYNTLPGGLPSNLVQGLQELKFTTYPIESAISFLKKYAARGDLNVVAKGIERMSNEILVKTEEMAWLPILASLATASTNGKGHLIVSNSDNYFALDELNRLWVLIKRLHTSYTGGTPNRSVGRLTDLVVSPEVMGQIRSMAYQPVNTFSGAVDTQGATSIPATDELRNQLFKAGGTPELFGVQLHEILELGPGSKYSAIFDSYYSGTFDGNKDDLVIGIDRTLGALLEPVVLGSNEGQVVVEPDDQFVNRSQKVGYWARREGGNVIIDDRALVGVRVTGT